MTRRIALLALAALLLLLTACTPEPVSQGMVTADGMTFLVSTLTDEKAGTVSVTVTLTNGTGEMLYLTAPEMADLYGRATAAYLTMSMQGAPSELDGLTQTGVTRRLPISPRESYSETRTFTVTLPAALTVKVSAAATLGETPAETQVEFDLK